MIQKFIKPISPISPIIPTTLINLPEKTALYFMTGLGFVAIAFITGYITARIMKSKWQSNEWINISISVIAMILLYVFFGASFLTVKGFILTQLLLYASNSDIARRECEDFTWVGIFITAFIGIQTASLVSMVCGAFFIFAVQISAVMLLKGHSIGGADIKIMTACAFLLGMEKGIIALSIGLLVACICTQIILKINRQKSTSFPLVPYLACAVFVTYLI